MAYAQITRRATLSAVGAATAAAGLGLAPVFAGEHRDAELLRLGKIFEAFEQEYRALRPEFQRCQALHDKAINDMPASLLSGTREERMAYYREAVESSGFGAVGTRFNALVEQSDPIRAAIQKMPAKTLAGLAVKARVCLDAIDFAMDDPKPEDDLDYDHMMSRNLAMAVIALAQASA